MGAWMLYALAIGLGASLAALAAERALRLFDAPQRWVWVAALAVSVLAPVALPLRALLDAPPDVSGLAPVLVAAMVAPPPGAARAAPAVEPGVDWPALFDAALGWGWLAATVVGVVVLVGSAASLARVRGRWRPGRVAGTRVLVSRSAGPAVVGCFWPAIVVPEWVLALPTEQRRLIVAHEREHLWARDPLLIAGALAAVVLAPWNLALWWQLRRLRLAIELDCDRRVLAGAADLKHYGELLLEIGRRSRRNWLPAAAFSEPASFLERRIRAMTFAAPRDRALRAAALLALVVAAPAALSAAPVVSHPLLARLADRFAAPPGEPPLAEPGAASIDVPRAGFSPARAAGGPGPFRIIALAPDPIALQGRTDSVPDGMGGWVFSGALDRVPALSNRGSIASIMQRLYPPILKEAGIGGTVLVQFVIEADGTTNPRSIKLIENVDHPELAEATFRAVERFRFRPGQHAGRNVRVSIQMPVNWDPKATAEPPVAAGSVRLPYSETVSVPPVVAGGSVTIDGAAGGGPAVVTTARLERQGRAMLADAITLAQSARGAEARSPGTQRQTILARAAVLVAQRYPALLTETEGGRATLFIIVAPDGEIVESRLVRRGEAFTWPAGTPTDFKRITTVRDMESLEFAPALAGTGIVWAEL